MSSFGRITIIPIIILPFVLALSSQYSPPPSVVICHFIAAVVYLELWKRYSANLIYRWGLVQFCPQAEHARPDYLAKLRTAKKQVFNFDTNVSEPRVPFWKKKFPMYLFSFSVVFLFVSLEQLDRYSGIAILHFSTLDNLNKSFNLFADSPCRRRRLRSHHLPNVHNDF